MDAEVGEAGAYAADGALGSFRNQERLTDLKPEDLCINRNFPEASDNNEHDVNLVVDMRRDLLPGSPREQR